MIQLRFELGANLFGCDARLDCVRGNVEHLAADATRLAQQLDLVRGVHVNFGAAAQRFLALGLAYARKTKSITSSAKRSTHR